MSVIGCKVCVSDKALLNLMSDVLAASSLTYYSHNFTEQYRVDPADDTGIPSLVIVIGVVVIILIIIVVALTIYLVRKHRRRKATQVRKTPEDIQGEVSV